MRQRTHALPAVTASAVVTTLLGLGGTADGQEGPWPDSRVAALWPSFSTVPAPETGGGGIPAWSGSFRGCVQSPRAAFDYACEYRDEQGRLGYVCLSPGAANAPISPVSIDARVAPNDPTYGSEAPTEVCYAALAYSLSLG
jgi:hypothetical protein